MGLSAEQINEMMPVGRVATRQEIGEVCLFLATDMAGQITSSTILCDGASWMINGNEKQRLRMYKQLMSKM
ncbi:acetoacetyl-CoA reductase [Plakobranchus ocellatus]|uniref:Acetoacetyl-CoA reductase n=1 Tax=Plakobranchus ocellatus TaxID=259542 RepID=A0AAV4DGA9_9GAST|nr:acetoacetyl-CoA reductase [Plakobranchus ocellatus]